MGCLHTWGYSLHWVALFMGFLHAWGCLCLGWLMPWVALLHGVVLHRVSLCMGFLFAWGCLLQGVASCIGLLLGDAIDGAFVDA